MFRLTLGNAASRENQGQDGETTEVCGKGVGSGVSLWAHLFGPSPRMMFECDPVRAWCSQRLSNEMLTCARVVNFSVDAHAWRRHGVVSRDRRLGTRSADNNYVSILELGDPSAEETSEAWWISDG